MDESCGEKCIASAMAELAKETGVSAPATNTVISSCRRRSTNISVRSANYGSPGAVEGNSDRKPIQLFNLVRSVTFQPQTPKMRVNFFALNARI